MLSHRERRQRRLQQNRMDVDSEEDESVEDGSALFDNNGDNGNDFVGEDESDTEEDNESSSSSIASGNLTESNESSSSRTSIVQRRTRARSMESALRQLSLQESSTSRTRSVGNGEEPMASPREARSLSRGRTENRDSSVSSSSPVYRNTRSRSLSRGRTENRDSNASSSSPVYRNTRSRSLSRGRTENRDSNASSSTLSTPAARRKRSNSRSRQQITSPLLSPIEKESKRVQEGGDTTLDTVDLTDVCDDTVHYEEEEEEEVSSPTSPSDAMIYDPSDKYDSVCPDSLEAILERLGVTKEELLKYPHLYRALTKFDANEIGPAIEKALSANAQNAQGLSNVAVEEEEEEEDVNEKENDYSPGSIVRISHVDELVNLPQDCAVLGLHSRLSEAMDENPKTEGHAFFMELLSECSDRFQGAKPNSNYTRNDVVRVSTAFIHNLILILPHY